MPRFWLWARTRSRCVGRCRPLADMLGFTLAEVAVQNVLKLEDRWPHGFDPEGNPVAAGGDR